MFDFSFYELMVFGIIALIVLGPEKLPQAVRTVGTYYAKFRRTAGTLKAEMEAELDLAETRQKMQEELAKIKLAEAEMQKEVAQLRGTMKEFEQQQSSQLKASADPATQNPPHADLAYSSSKTAASKSDNQAPDLDANTDTDANNLSDAGKLSEQSADTAPVMTRPWENMWFLLGDYDRSRRLPPAPLLPNNKANALLYDIAASSPETKYSPDSTDTTKVGS